MINQDGSLIKAFAAISVLFLFLVLGIVVWQELLISKMDSSKPNNDVVVNVDHFYYTEHSCNCQQEYIIEEVENATTMS